jgi:hypothetical protein
MSIIQQEVENFQKHHSLHNEPPLTDRELAVFLSGIASGLKLSNRGERKELFSELREVLVELRAKVPV